jgi:hypothetical protein
MNEMVFNSIHDFFNHIHSRGGANPNTHGTLGRFYGFMQVYTNPNTCSCKKGKNAWNNITNTVKGLSSTLTEVHLMNSRPLFDNMIVVVKESGTELVRF